MRSFTDYAMTVELINNRITTGRIERFQHALPSSSVVPTSVNHFKTVAIIEFSRYSKNNGLSGSHWFTPGLTD